MQNRKSLGLEEARTIGEAVIEAARNSKPPQDTLPIAVAVVDNAGELIYFAKMDGNSPSSTIMAINKAYTCIRFQMDGIEAHVRFLQDSIDDYGKSGAMGKAKRDMSWFGDPRLIPMPGALLVRSSDGAILGAVAISGRSATGPMGDEDLAQIGVKACPK